MNPVGELLTLALLPGVRPRHLRSLLARAPLSESLGCPEAHVDLLGPRAIEALRSGAARRAAAAEQERAGAAGVRLVGLDDADYPRHLREIFDPPPVLWVRGELDPGEGERAIAVVGCRAATREGLLLARELSRTLAAAGVSVVSGLARGVDTAAHEGALEAQGRGIAVLGSGLDVVYPVENAGLAKALCARGGAVVSEVPLGRRARPESFPRRNRILAGWSTAVVVVEAGARSGALITARCALDEGREVMAVPGHPGHENAAGTNALIRDGARLVRDARDVLEELGVELREEPKAAPGAPGGLLCALARSVPRSLEQLVAATGRPASALLSELAVLEVEARVRRVPGGAFVRA